MAKPDPEVFAAALGQLAHAQLILFAHFIRAMQDKELLSDREIASFLSRAEKSAWATPQKNGKYPDYVSILLGLVELLRGDLKISEGDHDA